VDERVGGAADTHGKDAVLAGFLDALAQFESNRAAYLESAAPEALHQTRVGLRRLRTALTIMCHHGRPDGVGAIQSEARLIGTVTGPARQCDVLLESIGSHFPRESAPGDVSRLIGLVEDYRAHCHADAKAFLEGAGTDAFLRAAREFASSAAVLDASPRKILDRLHRRALQRGRHFRSIDDEARHELRIALKKLRYGSEFFRASFGAGKRFPKFLKAAGRLQDLLGAHNDLVEASDFLGTMPGADATDLSAAKIAVTAHYGRRDKQAAARLSLAWKKFRRARPFWR
jgi:CHAD domain-containing protein